MTKDVANMLKNELKNDLKYGPISLEKEIEFGMCGNVTALQQHNLRFALGMVKEFMDKHADLFERGLLMEEEITSAAYSALGVACGKWNPSLGFKVATYAGWHIKKAMDQYMCKEVQHSSIFSSFVENRPNDDAIGNDDADYGSDALDYSSSKQNDADDCNVTDSEAIVVLNTNDYSEESSLSHFLDESVLVPQVINEVLTKKEAYVLMHSEGVCGCKKMKKQEIAAALNVSTETVRKTNKNAFDKLLKSEKLRNYWFAA